MPERQAPYGWSVMVVTPPPSETVEIARRFAFDDARRAADDWGGHEIEWTSRTEGIAPHGERVYIEPATLPRGRGNSLPGIRWDEIFETGVFEQWLGPELGFRLDRFGEIVTEDRDAYGEIWKKLESEIMDILTLDLDVDPYSISGGAIYPSDVNEIVNMMEARARGGMREWAPGPWSALANAFRAMLKEYGRT